MSSCSEAAGRRRRRVLRPVTMIILAAGRSSRMGSPKPLLDFAGQSLLGRLMDGCRSSLVDDVVVVLGHAADLIIGNADLSGVRVVINAAYDQGQTSSLQCGLRGAPARASAFMVLPVDYPFVRSADIDALVTAYRLNRGPARIFIPVCSSQEGRPALFDMSLRSAALSLAQGEPFRRIIDSARELVCVVPTDNPHLSRDMDTPADYSECLGIVAQEFRDAANSRVIGSTSRSGQGSRRRRHRRGTAPLPGGPQGRDDGDS